MNARLKFMSYALGAYLHQKGCYVIINLSFKIIASVKTIVKLMYPMLIC